MNDNPEDRPSAEGQPILPGMKNMRHEIDESERRRTYVAVKCACCDFEMDYDYRQNRSSCGDEATQYEGEPLCENCYGEDEADATLHVFDEDHPDGEGDYGEAIFEIGSCRNTTACNGDIGTWRVSWVKTDAWRGYVKLQPPKDWVEFHSDCSLMGSQDSVDLERFDKALRLTLIAKGARMVRATSRTSNCCSSGVDYFVEKKHLRTANAVAAKLAKVFRDPVRFNMTALTGKDPINAKAEDYMVAAFGAAILGGK